MTKLKRIGSQIKDSNYWITSKELKKRGIKCGENCKIHSTAIVTHPDKLVLGKCKNRCVLFNCKFKRSSFKEFCTCWSLLNVACW